MYVSVALVIQHAKCMHRVMLPSVACPAVPYISTLSHKRYDFRGGGGMFWTQNVFWFYLQPLSETFFIIRRIQQNFIINVHGLKLQVKCTRYRPGCGPEGGTAIALLFHDHGTRRGWVVSSKPRPLFTPGKTRYPLYRRLDGPQGRSGRVENLAPPGFDPRTAQPVAQSLYRLSYPAHKRT